jgi:hypothetical protein
MWMERIMGIYPAAVSQNQTYTPGCCAPQEFAANLSHAIAQAKGCKRAAENGLRAVRAMSVAQAGDLARIYDCPAAKQNTWLESACTAIEKGGTTAPDTSSAAGAAAASLIEWVGARNRALGEPELKGEIAETTKKSIMERLTVISTEAWNDAKRFERRQTQEGHRLAGRSSAVENSERGELADAG